MANVYHVTTDKGKAFDVTTTEHHDDHTDTSFKAHLAKIIESVATGASSGTANAIVSVAIATYVFKGKK